MSGGGVNNIMLIDDDSNDNFFHEREIRKILPQVNISVRTSGIEGLEQIRMQAFSPDIIFLDINMPVWDGWAFILEFGRLDESLRKGISIFMLTTIMSESEVSRARSWNFVRDFVPKPLTADAFRILLTTL